MLFVIAAPSGAGKTTIVNEILKMNPELIFSVSATTRKIRKGENEGKDYFFFTKEEFQDKINNHELVEYEVLFNQDYYGTLKSFVENNLEEKEKAKVKKEKAKQKEVIRKVRKTEKKRFSRSNLIKEADRVCSLYIRKRDKGNYCITCGANWEENFQA